MRFKDSLQLLVKQGFCRYSHEFGSTVMNRANLLEHTITKESQMDGAIFILVVGPACQVLVFASDECVHARHHSHNHYGHIIEEIARLHNVIQK